MDLIEKIVSSKEFIQLIIIKFCDDLTHKKIQGIYILINNKYKNSYVKVLSKIQFIVTLENT